MVRFWAWMVWGGGALIENGRVVSEERGGLIVGWRLVSKEGCGCA